MASNILHYYSEESSDPSPNVFETAQAAFDEALETLKQKPTKELKKRRHSFEATSLRDVVDAVTKAQHCYENERPKSKVRTCITKFSKRVCHYGNVMDVLVQHHPEYVALAWGAMKLIFGAIIEHENLARTVLTGLCDIADALPRVELTVYLYPTNAVKQSVSVLYAHIIKFLLRALEWYEEGKLAHAIHSIKDPAALRYGDLLEDIGRETRRIDALAIISSQAELRDIHNELRTLTSIQAGQRDIHNELGALTSIQARQKDIHNELQALTLSVKQLKEEMLLDQSLKASILLEFRHAFSDIYTTQTLNLVSSACTIDHKSTLQASLSMRDRHRLGPYFKKCPPFWQSAEIHAWNANQRSALITLHAPFRNRFYIRDFCTNVIEQLHSARVAVLWVLKPMEQHHHSAIEIFRSLVHQALTLEHASRTDSMLSFQSRKFLDARAENDYINLLGSCLERFKFVYIMVDAGAMNPTDAPLCSQHFQELLQRLSKHAASTIVKIMALSYTPNCGPLQQKDSILLRIGHVSRRKGKKLPSEPLPSLAESGRQQTRRERLGSSMPLRARGRAVRAAEG